MLMTDQELAALANRLLPVITLILGSMLTLAANLWLEAVRHRRERSRWWADFRRDTIVKLQQALSDVVPSAAAQDVKGETDAMARIVALRVHLRDKTLDKATGDVLRAVRETRWSQLPDDARAEVAFG